ncbi:hypothetical protein BBMN23_1551 [Bifidobacterium adolescentis]|nr:hypothetical protein BBMN23_1551 [Bifidobacterium adolescentis]
MGCEPQERLDEPQVEHLLAHIWNTPSKRIFTPQLPSTP